MHVQLLGTGTPLGQAGRLQPCLLLTSGNARLLVDCGMTSLVALARADVDPASLDAIAISHLHGDHFGGLPLVVLERALRQPGTPRRPLQVAGPAGTAERVRQVFDLFGWQRAWAPAQAGGGLTFLTLREREPAIVAGFELTAYGVPHAASTAPTALRIRAGGKTLAYSGDAGWTPALIEVAADADAFVCGVWSFDAPDPEFLDYAALREHRGELGCKRLILTHLGPSMLDHLDQLAADEVEVAADGQSFAV